MDREAIKQAVRDAADHQVACAAMGYDLRGVHLLMEVAIDYLRVTDGMPTLADGSVLAPTQTMVYRHGREYDVFCGAGGGYIACDMNEEHPLSECWPTREQSLVPPQVGDERPEATDPLPATLAALHHSREALARAIAAVEKLTEGRKGWQ